MKRKIFTFVAAITLVASTILPVSAAARSCRPMPSWFCFPSSFCCQPECRPCADCSDCMICPECPQCPEQDETPSVPEVPEEDETPSIPDMPEQEETPSVPDEPEQDNTPEPDVSAMSALEQAACELVNDQREANGLEPLTISSDLSVKARIKSQDMLENNYFDHNSPTYSSPFALMQSLGISFRTAGENIAMGYKTAEAVVSAWMNSPGHRANILSTNFDTFGIGHVDGYWTQWFIG